jgi:HK97 family phage major capsid protein
MTEQEFDALVQKFQGATGEAIKREVGDAVKGLLKAEELEGSLKALGIEKDDLKKLTEAVTKQGDMIKDLLDKTSTKVENLPISEQLRKQEQKIKDFASKTTSKLELTINIKDMLRTQRKATVIETNWGSNNVGMLINEINNDPFRLPVMRPLFPIIPVSPDSRGVIFYTEQDTVTRGAAARTTGQQAAESTLTWISRSASLCNITDAIRVAKEVLLDWSMMARELEAFIQLNLQLKEDTDLWSGDGSAPDLSGIYTYATAYVASGATYGTTPNYYDLIADMKLQVETGYNGKYTANTVVMNNADAQAMWSTKDADGNYIQPWFVNPQAKTVYGLKVVETSLVTAGTMVVGDFKQARLYVDENIDLEFGHDNDDFSKRLLTLVGNIREYLLVKNIDTLAFVKSADNTANIAALAAVA